MFAEGESVRVLEYNEDYKRKRIVARGPVTQRLYFYDLPSTVSTEEIKKMFSVYGKFLISRLVEHLLKVIRLIGLYLRLYSWSFTGGSIQATPLLSYQGFCRRLILNIDRAIH